MVLTEFDEKSFKEAMKEDGVDVTLEAFARLKAGESKEVIISDLGLSEETYNKILDSFNKLNK